MGSLTSLEWLDLHFNQLTGEIPAELGSLTNLEWLYLDNNQLTGEIPAELGSLTNLKEMHLNFNQLSGEIPAELGSLTNLEVLRLGGNSSLSGPLPSSFTGLTSLIHLYLGGTGLCAPTDTAFQDWLGGITERLGIVNCAADPLVAWGDAASDRAALVALYNATDGLNWSRNNTNWLSGRPLGEWYGVTTDANGRVTHLDLRSNNLSGRIPPELGNLSNLEEMILGDNPLSGRVPSELGSLSNLEWLDLSVTNLSGPLPDSFTGLASLSFIWHITHWGALRSNGRRIPGVAGWRRSEI